MPDQDSTPPSQLHSKHARLLNALWEMQGAMAYAVRRPVLEEAENLIASQEQEINQLKSQLASFTEKSDGIKTEPSIDLGDHLPGSSQPPDYSI